MTSTSDLPLQVKSYLIDASRALFEDDSEPLDVTRGHPGTYKADDILSWGRFTMTQVPGPISTRRTRHVTIKQYATVMTMRGGGREAEDVAEARALDIYDRVSEYLRVTDCTLGGLVLWCFATAFDSEGSNDESVITKGRLIVGTIEITAEARITTQ